jgi:hypothetical protein
MVEQTNITLFFNNLVVRKGNGMKNCGETKDSYQ